MNDPVIAGNHTVEQMQPFHLSRIDIRYRLHMQPLSFDIHKTDMCVRKCGLRNELQRIHR